MTKETTTRGSPLTRMPFALVAAAVMVVCACLSYWPMFLGKIPLPIDIVLGSPVFESIRHTVDVNRNHAELGDLVNGFYMVHAYAGAAVRAGVLPLWNPQLLLGQPFLAIYQSAVLYPPNLLYFVLPTAAAWAIGFPIRVVLAGLFAALFVRALGASRTGALVSGLAYAYSGFLLAWAGWPHVDVAVWLPLICLAIHRIRESPGPRRAALLAVAIAMALLGGHPQTVFYVLVFSGAFALHRLWGPRPGSAERDGRGRCVWWLAVGGVLGLGLAAVQLLPTAEWLSLLHRDFNTSTGTYLYRNNIFLFLSRDTRHTPNSAGLLIPEGSIYLGILPLFAAAFAVLHRARRDVVFLFISVLLVFFVAYGVDPVFRFVVHLPVFRGLPNWRVIVLADFALAVLAGLGVTALQERAQVFRAARVARERPPRALGWWLVLVGWGAVLLGCYWHLRSLTGTFDPETGQRIYARYTAYRGPTAALVLILVCLLLLSPTVARRLPAALFALLLLALTAGDLLSYSYGHVPFIKSTGAYPRAHLFDALQKLDPGLYRVAALDEVYPKNLELAYGLHAPSGTGYQVKAVDPLLAPFGDPNVASGYLLRSARVIANPDRRLDLLNVKYFFTSEHNDSAKNLAAHPKDFQLVLTEINAKVYRNIGVLPRSFVVPYAGAHYVDTVEEGYAVVAKPDFKPDLEVAVVGTRPITLRTGPQPRAYVAAASVEVSPNAVDVALKPGTEGILVLSDTWYPGWEVEVDGGPRPLLRVDGALKGVAVKAGDQHVHFAYRPRSFHVGALVTGASVLALLALLYLGTVPLPFRRR